MCASAALPCLLPGVDHDHSPLPVPARGELPDRWRVRSRPDIRGCDPGWIRFGERAGAGLGESVGYDQCARRYAGSGWERADVGIGKLVRLARPPAQQPAKGLSDWVFYRAPGTSGVSIIS